MDVERFECKGKYASASGVHPASQDQAARFKAVAIAR